MSTLDDKIQRRPDIAFQDVPEGAVLIDMVTGRCFELNGVGAQVWELIERPSSLRNIRETLLAKFSVTAELLGQDLLHLADELLRAGLVRTISADEVQTAAAPR